MTPSYRILYALAVVVTVLLAGLAAIQLADPDTLGLTPRHLAWAGVVAAMLGTLNGFLPRITQPPNESREGLD